MATNDLISKINNSEILERSQLQIILDIITVSVFHPDWLIRSNFRLRVSDDLHTDSHQNSWRSKGKKGQYG